MRSLWISTAALLLLNSVAAAQGQLTMSANGTFTFPQNTVSSPIIITVTNDTPIGSEPITNYMTAWQINFLLVADGGSSGTVTFNTPSGAAASPTNYVFPGGSTGIVVTNNTTTLLADDFNNLAAGNYIPQSPGANMFQFDVAASPTAMGTFTLFAIAGDANTSWTNAAASPAQLGYVNVPINQPGVQFQIAQFTVTPEPGTCLLFAAGVLGVGAAVRRRCRRLGQFHS